jgi:hypothetical protein
MPSIDSDVLKTKLVHLAAEQKELEASLLRIADRVQFLHELIGDLEGTQPSAESNGSTKSIARQGPTPAIIGYLSAHPDATPMAVVNALADSVITNAKDARNMLSALIRQMVMRGRLVRVGDKLRVVEKLN